jgi:hypothetical protein
MALTSQQYDGKHPLIYKQRCSHHSILVLGAIEKLQCRTVKRYEETPQRDGRSAKY